MSPYGADLAEIHEAGFSGFATGAAPALLALLRRHGIGKGRVLDLGCGPGHWARELTRAGYSAIGIDGSPAMIALARKRAPQAKFLTGSFFRVNLPRCDAATAMGEAINYCFDENAGDLAAFFRKLREALRPAGIFVFDFAEPGQPAPARNFFEGEGWAILVEKEERGRILTRRMTIFRKAGKLYRRTEEVHRQRLYRRGDIMALLRDAGFKVRVLSGYGNVKLPPAHAVLLASAPRAGVQ